MTVLTKHLARLVAERGEASADDLLPLVPGRTHAQVSKGLRNARRAGLVEVARIRSLGQGKGRLPGVYRVATTPRQPKQQSAPRTPVSSVWDWARAI